VIKRSRALFGVVLAQRIGLGSWRKRRGN